MGKYWVIRFSLLFFVHSEILLATKNQSKNQEAQYWIELAWKHSPEIQLSQAQVLDVESRLDVANAAFMPSLYARYQLRNFEDSSQTKVFSLNAEQNFFNGFTDYYLRESSKKTLSAEQSAFKSKKLQLAKNVSEAMLRIASASAQRKILDENSKILERRYKEFQRRTRIGRSRDVDLLQNQIDRLQLERLKASNERILLSAIATLKEYTGVQLEGAFEISKLLSELNDYHQSLDKVSYDRKRLQDLSQAQEYSVAAARGAFYPTVKGVASYFPENDSSFSRYTDDWSLGLDFEWRFFEGFSDKARLNSERALKIAADSKLAIFENDDQEVVLKLKSEWAQLVSEKKLVSEAEALAVKSFKAQERDFRLGLVTVLELSSSDEQYLDLKLEKITILEKLGLLLAQAIERGGVEGIRL